MSGQRWRIELRSSQKGYAIRYTISADIHCGRGATLSALSRVQDYPKPRVLPHSQQESFAHQHPLTQGICLLTMPYHTGGYFSVPPPSRIVRCTATTDLQIYYIIS